MKVCLGQRLVLVKLNQKLVSSAYVKFYLMSNLVQKNVFQLQSNGSTVGNIRIPILKSINLFLPPLEEQQKIAEILSTWDKAIELLEQLIVMKRKLKQGLMQQLLTGKRRFKEFEGSEWEELKIFDVVDLLKDGTHGTHVSCDDGIPMLSAKDVNNGKIFFDNEPRFISIEDYEKIHKNYSIKLNDVLLTVVGTLGRTAIVKTDVRFTLQRSVAILRAGRKILTEYLYFSLQSDRVQQAFLTRANASAQAGIYLGELAKIEITIPAIEEQKKVASVLSTADTEIETLEKQLSAYKQQKRGLMQQLLTGKKRVASPPSTVFDSGRPLSNFVERGENLA
jgi:type I restriction enzyme, S subunit